MSQRIIIYNIVREVYMNDERFIDNNSWTPPVSDPEDQYQLLLNTNKKLGRAALGLFPQAKRLLKQSKNTSQTKFFSPMSQKAAALYDRVAKLKSVVRRSHEILASATTVILPVNLFPDTIVVDRTKITITKRTFFWSSSIISVRIEDVLNVGISSGPLFGSLTISSRVMNSTDHFEVSYFWRGDATRLKHIIQGYMIAHHNAIDTEDLSRDELIETLLELGRDSN